MPTIIERLAIFAAEAEYAAIPDDVREETKRLLLDSLGCALAGGTSIKGRVGIDFGRLLGAGSDEATIVGQAGKTSRFGAAFANGELINALDHDAILPPGHVSPYVIPGALALAEIHQVDGQRLLTALAVAHEISYRFGKSMDWTRDTEDGKVAVSAVLGYTSPVFGAAAANALVEKHDQGTIAHALGIAGSTTPVNSHRSWLSHVPTSSIKYTMAGPVVQTALMASTVAAMGHTGDLQVLDDADYGYRRFIGSKRWVPENLTDALGSEWRFPRESSIKPYPHCRVMHTLFDTLTQVMDREDLQPREIDAMRAWGEGWIDLPVWENDTISELHDAQFSVHHGLAVAAQRIPAGPAWQDADVVYDPAVFELMPRISYYPHPDYLTAIAANPAARPARIEIDARGTTFVGEGSFPKGSPSPDPSTDMTTAELVTKFMLNAERSIDSAEAGEAGQRILSLEDIADVSVVMELLRPSA